MEKDQRVKVLYKYRVQEKNWKIIDWEDKKYSFYSRHYSMIIGGDAESPDALTVMMGDEKGYGLVIDRDRGTWGMHNGDEIVLHVAEGPMHWWTGPPKVFYEELKPGTLPAGEEKLWYCEPGTAVNFPAGTPHTIDPAPSELEDSSIFVLYNPTRKSSKPIPKEPASPHFMELTEISFDNGNIVKFFDYKKWRCTYLKLKMNSLEKMQAIKNEWETYIYSVRGCGEFSFNSLDKNKLEKFSMYPWEALYIPPGLSFTAKIREDWIGVVLTRNDGEPGAVPGEEYWDDVIGRS